MNNGFPFKDIFLEKHGDLFERQDVPARTILLREGEVAQKIFYIENGCLRLWFNNNGNDVTFQFFFEGDSVASIESFRWSQPSMFSIETIEPCTVLSIGKKDFNTIINSQAIRDQVQDNIFHRLIFYQKLFLSRIKESPQERYEELLKNNPEILMRVPQHYIASYLGITPVSLSRIRNRR